MDYLNIILASVLLSLPLLLLLVHIVCYPPGNYRYSVVYASLDSSKSLSLLLYILIYLRPYLLAATAILIGKDYPLTLTFIFIACSIVNLILVIINAYNFKNKIAFILRTIKSLLGLFILFSIQSPE